MVLAAGVSAFHTSAAAGLRWQQLRSPSKPPSPCAQEMSLLPPLVLGSLEGVAWHRYGLCKAFGEGFCYTLETAMP